jgi:hypothetical protein
MSVAGTARTYSAAAKGPHWLLPHIGRNTPPSTVINLHFSFGVLVLAVMDLAPHVAVKPALAPGPANRCR